MIVFDPARSIEKSVKTLKRRVRVLKKSAAEQVVQSAQLAGAREIAKAGKSLLPSGYKYLKKGIRARVVRRKSKGQRIVKVGFGVGLSREKQDAIKRKRERKRGSGSGISIRNIHWKVTGLKTRNRRHKSGKPTGTHGPDPKFQNFMYRAAQSGRSSATRAIRRVGKAKLAIQVAKIRKKR